MTDNIKLNFKNFFSYFVFHPWSKKLSDKDKAIASIATVIFFPTVIGPIICKLCFYKKIKEISKRSKVDSALTSKIRSQSKESKSTKSKSHSSISLTSSLQSEAHKSSSKSFSSKSTTASSSTSDQESSDLTDKMEAVYTEVQLAIQQLGNKQASDEDKIVQYDLIEKTVKNGDVSWLEFLQFLKQNYSEDFHLIFNVALLKKEKSTLTPFLSVMDLEKLGPAIENKITVKIEDREFVLNKDLLSTFIPYFSTSFHFQNITQEIQLEDIDLDVFESILNYLFFNKKVEINGDNLIQWIHAQSFLELPEFYPIMEDFITVNYKQIDFSELTKIFKMYNFIPTDAIKAKMDMLLEQPYKNLTPEEINELLKLIPFAKTQEKEIRDWIENNFNDLNLDKFVKIFKKYEDFAPTKLIENRVYNILTQTHVTAKNKEELDLLAPFVEHFSFDNVLPEIKEYLPKMVKLRAVHIWSEFKDYSILSCFNSLPKLQYLVINSPIPDSALSQVTHLPNLEHIELYINNISDKGIARLASFPNLRSVTLNTGLIEAKETRIVGEGLLHLAKLPKLKEFSIDCSNPTDQMLESISSFSNLRSLTIGGSDKAMITEAGLAHLPKLENLRKLGLQFMEGFHDGDLSFLQNMNSLSTLDLQSCSNLTDAVLVHITKTKLLRLERRETQISPNALVSNIDGRRVRII